MNKKSKKLPDWEELLPQFAHICVSVVERKRKEEKKKREKDRKNESRFSLG